MRTIGLLSPVPKLNNNWFAWAYFGAIDDRVALIEGLRITPKIHADFQRGLRPWSSRRGLSCFLRVSSSLGPARTAGPCCLRWDPKTRGIVRRWELPIWNSLWTNQQEAAGRLLFRRERSYGVKMGNEARDGYPPNSFRVVEVG